MKVSIIIATYNKLPRLKLTLSSLLKQTMPIDSFEVILVDDCSTDGTQEYMEKTKYPFHLIYQRLRENSGRSKARNIGIGIASSSITIFTDDDCIMHPRFIEEHVDQYKEGYATHGAIYNLTYLKFFVDPTKGILYPEFESRNMGNLSSMCITESDITNHFDEIVKIGKKTKFEKEVEKALSDSDHQVSWIGCTGGNIAVSTDMLKQIGCFDENFGREWGIEDIEIGYRLYQSGIRFQYCEEASVYHIAHYRMNSNELSKRAISYMEKKHKDTNLEGLYENFFDGSLDYKKLMDHIKCVKILNLSERNN